jgi:hypothetical protein
VGGVVAVGILAVAVAAGTVEFGDGIAALHPGAEDLGQLGHLGQFGPPGVFPPDEDGGVGVGAVLFAAEAQTCVLAGGVLDGGDQVVAG